MQFYTVTGEMRGIEFYPVPMAFTVVPGGYVPAESVFRSLHISRKEWSTRMGLLGILGTWYMHDGKRTLFLYPDEAAMMRRRPHRAKTAPRPIVDTPSIDYRQYVSVLSIAASRNLDSSAIRARMRKLGIVGIVLPGRGNGEFVTKAQAALVDFAPSYQAARGKAA